MAGNAVHERKEFAQKPDLASPETPEVSWTPGSADHRAHGDHENFVERIFLSAVDPEISDG